MKTIQFDVDGVLANFTSGYIKLYEEIHQSRHPSQDGLTWDDFWDRKTWDEIKRSYQFWNRLTALLSADDWQRLIRMARYDQVYFVTHRVGPNPKQQTEAWLRRYGIDNPTVVVTSKKGEFAKTVGAHAAIDDKAGNAVFLSYYAPDTKAYLLDTVMNKFDHRVLGGKVTRVLSVTRFLDDVESA